MAVVVGDSGAWNRIVSELASYGHLVSSPQDIYPLLVKLEAGRPLLIESRRRETLFAISLRDRNIAGLEAESWFFRRLLNWFAIRALKSEIKALRTAELHYLSMLDRGIARVHSLVNSAELAGAEAELAVLDQLRALPSPAIVFNDVRLQANRHTIFNGATLASAQLDHLVLTPAGVFIIETKRWSRHFVDAGAFYSPFEQVGRANYLCYDLLRWNFGKTKVRSIIASAGSLPEAPRDSYVKVVRPESLTNYISWFRDVELDTKKFGELCDFFERRTAK